MKHLLVATDLSERSYVAIARAIALARSLSAKLTVLYVVESDLPEEVARTLQEAAEPVLRKRVAELSGSKPCNAAIRVERGRDWALITETALGEACDLIVMGAHRDTCREMTRGSTIDRVIRHSGLPVLIAKTQSTGPYRQILAAIDFSLPSRRAAAFAASMSSGAALRLIHIYDQPLAGMFSIDSQPERLSSIEEMLKDEVPQVGPGAEVVLRAGQTIGTLYDAARDWPADLLVLGTHGRTGVGLAMLGSVAEQFVAKPPCDLLIVKAW